MSHDALLFSAYRSPRTAPSGAPVLLIGGLMMTSSAWDAVAEPLAQRRPVLTLDLRGQLLSPGLAPDSFAGHAEDVIEVLEKRGIPRVHVAGTSFGAAVALVLAARYPERVASVVPITAAAAADEHFQAIAARWEDGCRAVLEGAAPRPWFAEVFADVYGPRFREAAGEALERRLDALAELPRGWFEQLVSLMKAVGGYELGSAVSRIDAPALVISAEDDGILPPRHGASLAETLGARHEVVPEAGHGLVLERPDRVAALLAPYYDELDALPPL